jgi:hypothetical protein
MLLLAKTKHTNILARKFHPAARPAMEKQFAYKLESFSRIRRTKTALL